MKYETLNAQLTGRNEKCRKLANNTYAERKDDGSIAIRLHQTDIAVFKPDGTIVANTGGWKTHTTKDRLNEYLPARIWQKSGRWFLGENGTTIEFADGLTFHPDGTITGAKPTSQADEEKKLQKRITAYCAGLVAALPLAKPGAGDCFYCQMREEKTGKPLGECAHDTSHLDSHLEENYFVPSLVWNALEMNGCNPQGGGSAYFMAAFSENNFGDFTKKTVGKMVKKYLRRQFGLA